MKPFLKRGYLLQDTETKKYYRVFKAIEAIGEVHLVSISETAETIMLPERYHIISISKKFDEGKLIVPDVDPFVRSNENVSESQQALATRAYDKIKDIVYSDVMLDPSQRYELIQRISLQEPKASIPTIIKWIKQWCVGRMMESALIPNFNKCGGVGKKRDTRKTTQAQIDLIDFGFQKYFLDEPTGTSTVKQAWENTLKKHWKKELHGDEEFSEDIFRRYAKDLYPDAYENKVRRCNQRNAAREGKLNRGMATDIANGPGTVFQIDWTQMDVNLIASFNRLLYIGKPKLYVVADTYSRLIVGILITLQNPSFWTFCQAIYYAAMNKVKLAAMYGLTIIDGDWLGECVSVKYIADNGEARGKLANVLGSNIKVGLGNVQTYRGDFKPIVERLNLTIKSEIKPWLVGNGHIVDRYGKRLGIDPRREACITLEELYQIAFRMVIQYNDTVMPNYPDMADMVAELVDKTPNAIWKWACEKNHGVQTYYEDSELWYSFLERKTRTPDSTGFVIENHHFIPENEVDQKLLENLINRPNGAGQQIIGYDENCFKRRYWIYEGRFIPLRKIGEDEQEFTNIWEMVELNAYYREREKQKRIEQRPSIVEHDRANEELMATAKAKKGDNGRVVTKDSSASREMEKQKENETHKKLAPSVTPLPEPEVVEEILEDELVSPYASAFASFRSRPT